MASGHHDDELAAAEERAQLAAQADEELEAALTGRGGEAGYLRRE